MYKLDNISEIGVYANISSHLEIKDIYHLSIINKCMCSIYTNGEIWIELIRLKFPKYLKSTDIYFNYEYIYTGLIDFIEMMGLYHSEKIKIRINKLMKIFYCENGDTLKYLILTDILNVKKFVISNRDIIFEIFKLEELYNVINNHLLIYLLNQLINIEDNLVISEEVILENTNQATFTFIKIINIKKLLSYSLAYADINFLESVYHFILNLMKSTYKTKCKEKFKILINSSLLFINTKFLFCNTINIKWLLYRSNDYYAIEDMLILFDKNNMSNAFLSFIVSILPDNFGQYLFTYVESLIYTICEREMTYEIYHILNKYMNLLSHNIIEKSIEVLFDSYKYYDILYLIENYKFQRYCGYQFYLQLMNKLREASEIKLKEIWSRELSSLLKFLDTFKI